MAKVMQYTDQFGNVLPESYWRIVQVNLGVANHASIVLLHGYKDKAARLEGKAPVGQRVYSVSGAAFDTLMAEHLAPGGPNMLQLIYQQVVNTTNDVPAPTQEDPDRMANFFEGATDDLDPSTGQAND